MRAALQVLGAEELGFGTDTGEQYTWVILARTEDVERMHQLLWDAWSPERDAFRALQGGIAASVVADNLPEEGTHPN